MGHWPFENSGNDASGNNNTGTVSGASYTNGRIGRCLTFNGTSDNVALASSVVNPKTLACWSNFNSITSTSYFFGGNTQGARYDGSTFLILSGTSGITTVAWTKVNAMVHFAATISGTTYTIYINAVQIGTGNTGGTGNLSISHIGKRADAPFYFTGPIDEPCLFSYAIPACSIKRLMLGIHPIR